MSCGFFFKFKAKLQMGGSSSKLTPSKAGLSKSIFDFSVKGGDGSTVDLATKKGKKAYLIVNVATE